jgi:hypothetical protein
MRKFQLPNFPLPGSRLGAPVHARCGFWRLLRALPRGPACGDAHGFAGCDA